MKRSSFLDSTAGFTPPATTAGKSSPSAAYAFTAKPDTSLPANGAPTIDAETFEAYRAAGVLEPDAKVGLPLEQEIVYEGRLSNNIGHGRGV